jgi:hypothetical protein
VAGTILLVTTACASGGGGSTATVDSAFGALSAESAVGHFLDAAKRSDYQLMSRLFGTRQGPAEKTLGRLETEQRMFVLAALLQHNSYELRRLPVAEAEGQRRVAADMVGTRQGNVVVPFLTSVNNGRWFVEQIGTEWLSSG